MLPVSLPLPKGASLATSVSMHHAALSSAAPPSLIDVRHMYARGGAPAFAPIAKVPSLMELNARASSPGGVKVAPVKSLEEAEEARSEARAAAGGAPANPRVPIAARAMDAAWLVREAEARRAAAQGAGVAGATEPAPEAGVTCANCRTQKTPLWRNGPLGPKTLCNACGVRFKLGKLPPPGGWPPGHVPPPAPPRKRPALLDSNGHPVKRSKVGDKGDKLDLDGKPKKKRRLKLAPDVEAEEGGEYLRAGKVAKSTALLTDYDGAVLLMVLAGMYSH